jgi:protocatechuate 3,4-dioxygenase beta subunit
MSRSPQSPVLAPDLTRRTLIGATAGLALTASSGGTSGSTGSKGGGDGTSETGGGGGAGGQGGSSATGGAGGSGGSAASPDAGASVSPDGGDYPDDARIETGRPDGMTDIATPGTCVRTDANDEGPFYMPNAPFRSVLADKADGQWLVVTGRVLNTKCEGLAGAVVDIWHSNGAPDGKSDYDNDPRGMFRWRGKIRVDAQGSYSYETIKPGRYNNGGQLRPSHIHYKITAPGYQELTTQFQPTGDSAFDDIAKHSLDIPFVQENGVWKAKIDIVFRPGLVLREPRSPEPKPRRRSFFFLGQRTRLG